MMEMERRRRGNRRTKEREGRKKRRDGEAMGKKKTQTWTPNTCALARTIVFGLAAAREPLLLSPLAVGRGLLCLLFGPGCGCRVEWILGRPKISIYCTSSISMKNITPTSSPSVGISQVPQSPLQASPTDFQNACRRGGGSRVGEDWRLRRVAPAAIRSCRTQQMHNRAIGTGCTGARGRHSPHGGAQPNLRLRSRLDGADRDERFANTGSSDGPVADAVHPDVRERVAQQTHEVAIGDAPTSGQRSCGRAREDFGCARACELCRPARRSQPVQLRMPVQTVPGDRGDLVTQRARGADRGNGTLHGQASSQRGCGDEPRFVTICGRQTCVGDLGAHGARQGKGRASGKTKAEGGQVMPELGKGTACIHSPAPQSGSLNGERGSHFRPPWRPVARELLPLPLPQVL